MTETEEKPKRASRMLGLAFSERAVLVAEVASAPGGLELTRAATFAFPVGVSLSDPDALGTALGQFLNDNGYATRAAVLGIPAKWVLSKSKEVPPADAATAAEVLRLQAEGEFSADLKDLAFDYAGEANAEAPSTVLLMAVPSRYVAQVTDVARAAKLRPAAVTPIAAALGAATGRRAKHAAVLSLGPGGAEYTAQLGSHPVVMRHLGPPAASVPMLMAELRRLSAMTPASTVLPANSNGNGSSAGSGRLARDVVLWDDVGMPAAARQAVGAALGTSVADGTLASFGITDARDAAHRNAHVASAVALALAGLRREGPPVDFLHSRLAPPQPQRIKRETILAVAAGVLVLIGIIWALVDLNGQRNELVARQAKLKDLQPALKKSREVVDRIAYARAWHASQPRYLACLRDVAQVIPEDGETFLTGFALRDNMKGTLSGKSTNAKSATDLSGKLKATRRFAEVETSLDSRVAGPAGRGAQEVSFSLTFRYIPPTQPEPPPVIAAAVATPSPTGNPGRDAALDASRGGGDRDGESGGRSFDGRR